MANPEKIDVGSVVSTSYGTGPYRVVGITRDCTCPKFLEALDLGEAAPASPSHLHLVCVAAATPVRPQYPQRDCYWLGGYAIRPDGRVINVWSGDELQIQGHTPNTQLTLELNHGETT